MQINLNFNTSCVFDWNKYAVRNNSVYINSLNNRIKHTVKCYAQLMLHKIFVPFVLLNENV